MKGESLRFEVRGLPVAQGSLRAFVIPGRDGRRAHAVVTHEKKADLGSWRGMVSGAALRAHPSDPWTGPVALDLRFRLPQPKSRRTSVGRGKKKRTFRIWPDRTPDLDKLARAVLDSLSRIVFVDDAQVVDLRAAKDYGPPGLKVRAWRIVVDGPA
jgi:crossover junction endodeoxyribonuclease RusA